MEEWRAISGWEGFYEVSDEGRVRSLDRVGHRNGHPARFRGRILAACIGKNGYRTVQLCSPEGQNRHYVHRLVAFAFFGECPSGHEVCHQNGTRSDNRKINLRYGTHQSNCDDMRTHGTSVKFHPKLRGEKNGCSKLTDEEVHYIRRNPELTLTHLGELFGVHRTSIHHVRTGKNWKYLTTDDE